MSKSEFLTLASTEPQTGPPDDKPYFSPPIRRMEIEGRHELVDTKHEYELARLVAKCKYESSN